MRTVTQKIYSFRELPAEMQKTEFERERGIRVQDDWWYRARIEDWQARLSEAGYKNPRILFSGFGSQGDGACFEADIDLVEWLTQRRLSRKYEALNRAAVDAELDPCLKHRIHSYYPGSTNLDWNYFGDDNKVLQELDQVEALILEDRDQLGRQIYRDLEQDYEWATSDEAIGEELEALGWEFLKNGTRFIE